MCGIGGFVAIGSAEERECLTYALGLGIDRRGGHASGFVGHNESGTLIARTRGTWDNAKDKFWRKAFMCDRIIMHARYATCGNKNSTEQAHPFSVYRDGAPVVHGVHNGIIWDAREHAEKRGRKYTVDSRELYNVVADADKDAFTSLHGYGTLAYCVPGDDRTFLLRMSDDAALEVAAVKGGGCVFGSTIGIVKDALELAGRELDYFYAHLDVGTICAVNADGSLWTTNEKGWKLSGRVLKSNHGPYHGGFSGHNHRGGYPGPSWVDTRRTEPSPYASGVSWHKNERTGIWEKVMPDKVDKGERATALDDAVSRLDALLDRYETDQKEGRCNTCMVIGGHATLCPESTLSDADDDFDPSTIVLDGPHQNPDLWDKAMKALGLSDDDPLDVWRRKRIGGNK